MLAVLSSLVLAVAKGVRRASLTCQGIALWDPNPPKELYDRVSIGDVGYLQEGTFMRMFNVMLPGDDPSNRRLGYLEPYCGGQLDVNDGVMRMRTWTGKRQSPKHTQKYRYDGWLLIRERIKRRDESDVLSSHPFPRSFFKSCTASARDKFVSNYTRVSFVVGSSNARTSA